MMQKYRILWIAAAVFVLDQISKWIVQSNMELYASLQVLGNFFRITFVENPGMAFGLQLGNNLFFTVFAVLASIAIVYYLLQLPQGQKLARLALSLILGGAMGNLLDRLLRGKVVDFLDFEFFDIHLPTFKFLFFQFPGYELERWPVFNVADMAVTVGMFLLLGHIVFEKEEQPEPTLDGEMVR
jgi:signal peptidase II